MTLPKPGDLLENLPLTDTSSDGRAIARLENFVVFVEGGVPGDRADVHIYRKKKNFAEGRVERIVRPSPDRIDPVCSHFGSCGGCKWQHFSYAKQLESKQAYVRDAFERIGKLDIPAQEPILGSADIFAYRNRLDFSCANKRWLTREELNNGASAVCNVIGFHAPQRFDKVLDIDRCHLQDDRSNVIRKSVLHYATENGFEFFDPLLQTGFLRNLTIRNTSTDEWMVLVVFAYEDESKRIGLLQHLSDQFPYITSLQFTINGKRNDTFTGLDFVCFKRKEFIEEEMEGLRFRISAKSFYQTNSQQAYRLYQVARDYAGLTGNENVYDLYTGTGTIALFVARQAARVAGIDYVEEAIGDARINARNNGIDNVSFAAGDLKATLNEAFIEQNGRPDVVITDPPRSGMHEDVVATLLRLNPERIVYVSCNPSTQARDIQLMDEAYSVVKMQAVDMFPHTTHVENVALLVRRG